ncbi:hypothetical protein J5N97_024234 [Dioscorea zingiberensis]|uniref:Uncharacterized protein n=1 Tax=Dioscorea zingiberensis TaxID=325984 RepID=A0A9D5C7C5_9LILI|nr:hypothetical protein J5N97_024234 [Dioscorea zingiberensis]
MLPQRQPPTAPQLCSENMESDPVNVNEFQELARKILPKMNYDYFSGRAKDEYTLRELQEFLKISVVDLGVIPSSFTS